MEILGSRIKMQATHSKITSNKREESLRFWVGDRRPDFENLGAGSNRANVFGDSLQLSEDARRLIAEKNTQPVENASAKEIIEGLKKEDKELIWLLEAFLSQLTGKKVKLDIAEDVTLPSRESTDLGYSAGQPQQSVEPAGWGLEYEYHETQYESEKMTFTAEGVIQGNQGQKINFSIEMNMSRQFYSRTDFSLRAGDAKLVDPLVINFNGNLPDLTDLKFKFDLDADGNEDQISFLKPGSGFLAFDKNEDGQINNGSELFGPTTGNGFDELSAYDEDQNGWIDEQDSIFDKLWVWSKDHSGNDKLIALSEAGVGAIYLGHLDTPFDFKDGNNNLQGMAQRTGIYVNNDDTVGTIQQIDLTV